MASYQLEGSIGIPNDQFTSPSPPPLPFPPPPPPMPPATPGFRHTGLYYTVTQEFVLAGTTTFSDAADRCRPLASNIHPEFGKEATALIEAPESCGTNWRVISCGYTAPRDIIVQLQRLGEHQPAAGQPERVLADDASCARACARCRCVSTADASQPKRIPPCRRGRRPSLGRRRRLRHLLHRQSLPAGPPPPGRLHCRLFRRRRRLPIRHRLRLLQGASKRASHQRDRCVTRRASRGRTTTFPAKNSIRATRTCRAAPSTPTCAHDSDTLLDLVDLPPSSPPPPMAPDAALTQLDGHACHGQGRAGQSGHHAGTDGLHRQLADAVRCHGS